jgi:hypothetical protein
MVSNVSFSSDNLKENANEEADPALLGLFFSKAGFSVKKSAR